MFVVLVVFRRRFNMVVYNRILKSLIYVFLKCKEYKLAFINCPNSEQSERPKDCNAIDLKGSKASALKNKKVFFQPFYFPLDFI